ncbi:MAG: HipA domain-containing protein, partial [Aeromonas veronii]
MRIKEAVECAAEKVPEQSRIAQRRFPLMMVLERDTDFLEYAQQMGAASGGATGAGGEAPKLLLRQTPEQEVWIDTFQDDPHCLDAFYLVKFPRNNRSAIDQDILRAEYHYYQELNALGVDTIPVHGMRLEEGDKYPSLWLPRFDVAEQDGKLIRFGVESIYSVMGAAPGSDLNHLDVLATLLPLLEDEARLRRTHFDSAAFVIEWVRRDLLNVVFGNSDNHGRTTALLKSGTGIWLAPVYDFAPMKADPEGIRRTTQWGLGLEEGGEFDWVAIAQHLSRWADSDILLTALTELAQRLKGLKGRLELRGVPEAILQMPTFNFNTLDDR